jgi:hypothetical protein
MTGPDNIQYDDETPKATARGRIVALHRTGARLGQPVRELKS